MIIVGSPVKVARTLAIQLPSTSRQRVMACPHPVHRRLRLVAGSRLRITEGPRSILLEPEHEEARIEEKGGILVVVTLNPADFEQLAAEVGPRIVVPPDPPRVTAG